MENKNGEFKCVNHNTKMGSYGFSGEPGKTYIHKTMTEKYGSKAIWRYVNKWLIIMAFGLGVLVGLLINKI